MAGMTAACTTTISTMLQTIDETDSPNLFGETLRHYRQRQGIAPHELAFHLRLPETVIRDLEMRPYDVRHMPVGGIRYWHPSRDQVICIGFELRLKRDETDDLLLSAGYAALM